MLLLLPSELQAAVLTPWLEIVDVANLDSAACNHADRSQWLDSIYSPVYDFASRRSDPDFQPTLLEHVDHNTEVADAYVRWILKHSIRLSSLCITGSLNTVDSYMRNHGRHLTKIEFGEGFNTSVKKLTHIHQFCPNVTHVACPQGFGPSNMHAIAHSWPLLQEITLFNGCNSKCLMLIAQLCSNLRSITVLDCDSGQLSYRAWYAFFTEVNADLRHVRCYGNIEKKTLLVIVQRCAQLRTLEGNLEGISCDVVNTIIALCPMIESFGTRSPFPALVQDWHLRSLTATSVNAQALQLLPVLQTLKLYMRESDVRRVIAAITAHCPHLVELAFLPVKLPEKIVQKIPVETLNQLFPPGTLPKPRFDGPYDKLMAALVQRCPLLEILATNVTIGAATLAALGTHCHDLRSLRAECLSDGVTDTALSALAEGCSKLRHLRLQLSKEDRHFERAVTALTTHCSHVRKVVLDCPLYEMKREYVKRVHNVTVVDETAQAALKARTAQAEADQKVMPFYEAHGNY